jgi:hypothetical protein
MEKSIKILLAILFFLCLVELPYGFYQLVRFAAMVGFAILSYRSFEKEYKTEMVIYIVLAILFQPLLKISLGREIWNVIDVFVGIGLLVSIFYKPKPANEE